VQDDVDQAGMETLHVKTCVRGYRKYLQKNLEPNSSPRVELRARNYKQRDPYAVAVMRNSAVVGLAAQLLVLHGHA